MAFLDWVKPREIKKRQEVKENITFNYNSPLKMLITVSSVPWPSLSMVSLPLALSCVFRIVMVFKGKKKLEQKINFINIFC